MRSYRKQPQAILKVSNYIKNSDYISIYFKVGYFKPIHSVCIDLVKFIDKYTIKEISELTSQNILFTLSNESEEKKKQILNTTNFKQIVFAMPLGMGFINGPPVIAPFLPNIHTCNSQYTLVLDLDETLVHFFYTPSGGTFLVRPFAHEFLKTLAPLYEIVIFTAAMKDVSYS